ncbi:MAG: YggT family protein [Rhodoluna sp.]
MGLIALVIYWLLQVYFFALIGRFIFDLILSINPYFRPRGVLIVVAESIYTVTDPPLKLVRKIIPPLRLGAIQLDFGWTLVFVAVLFLQKLVISLA